MRRQNFASYGLIEQFIEFTPIAIIALVHLSLKILKISAIFPRRIVFVITTYITGLICLDKKQTALRIAKYIGGVSHDKITRSLVKQKWSCSVLMIYFIKLIEKIKKEGILIIDDTLLKHPKGKKMEGVYWDWDHTEKRNMKGQRVVFLIWSDGFWRIPVAFSIWHKEGVRKNYKTKNEIAMILLSWAIKKGIKTKIVTFDNWYASKDNLKFIIKELGLHFVTRVKKNCRLCFQARSLQAKTIGKRILSLKRQYKNKELGVYPRSAKVELGDIGSLNFVVVKDDLDGESSMIMYLLTSISSLCARDVVLLYRQRWAIEVMFQNLKEHLGLENYQGQKLLGAHCHIASACLAMIIVDFLRKNSQCSFDETVNTIKRLIFVSSGKNNFRLATISAVPIDNLNFIQEAEKIIQEQLFMITPLQCSSKNFHSN